MSMRMRDKLDVIEVKCLWNICRMNWMYRVGNEEVRCIVGVREKVSGRVDRKVLKCFRQVYRMTEEQMTYRVESSVV